MRAEAAEPAKEATGLAKGAELAKAEKEGEKKGADAKDKKSSAPVNVFGTAIAPCGQEGECSFTSYASDLCIANVPYDKQKFWNGMPGSDMGVFVGNTDKEGLWKQVAQCLNFWDYGVPPMMWGQRTIGKGVWIFPWKEDITMLLRSWGKRLKYGFVDDVLVCEAVPSAVLDSDYSKDMWENCEVSYSKYVYTKGNPTFPGGKEMLSDESSRRCMRFRQSIERVCEVCAGQAPNDGAKSTLSSMCEAVGVGGPAPAPGRRFGSPGYKFSSQFESAIPLSLIFVVSALFGFKVFRSLRKSVPELQEPILQPQAA